MTRKALVLLLLLFGLALLLPGQMSLPPFDRDEARFAQASRQMVQSGDYVDIHFQTTPRHKKPIGIYWLQSAAVQVTGAVDQIWAYRIPSWLGALAAVLLTGLFGARFISPQAGLLAGGMLASCLLIGVEARMAKTDAAQLACIMAAQFILARAWMQQLTHRSEAMLFWLALGAGVLIKGPIILMVCGLTALVLCVVRRSGAWLRALHPGKGMLLMLAVVLPWLIAITLRSKGAFWSASVGEDMLAKVGSGKEAHGLPPGYYFISFFLTFWPWAPLALFGGVYAWRARRTPLVQFLLAWIVPFWLAFELIPTKLPHYTLPVFPAIALLITLALTSKGEVFARGLRWAVVGFSGLLIAVVGLIIPFTPQIIAHSMNRALPLADLLTLPPLPYLLAGFGLILAALLAFALRACKPRVALGLVAIGLVLFYGTAYHTILPRTDALWVSRSAALLVAAHQATCPDELASVGYNEPSLVFLTRTDIALLPAQVPPPPLQGCRLLLVEGRQLGGIDPAQALGQVSGLNTQKGKAVTLYLFAQKAATP